MTELTPIGTEIRRAYRVCSDDLPEAMSILRERGERVISVGHGGQLLPSTVWQIITEEHK